MNITINRLTLLWLLSSHTGLSSRALCAAYFGAPVTDMLPGGDRSPCDPADFQRCCEFLETLSPDEKKIALLKANKLSPRWEALVNNWERLEKIEDNSELYNEIQRTTREAKK